MKNIDFTKKQTKKSHVPAVVAGLVVLIIILGAASFLVILAKNDFSLEKFFGTREPASEEQIPEETTLPSVTDAAPAFSADDGRNYLFICSDDDKNMTFCIVMCVSREENSIRIKPVSTELQVDYRGTEYTLTELYRTFSSGGVKDALEARGIPVVHYASFSETSFKQLMQKLGSVSFELPADISFSVEAITYTYSAGPVEMTSDSLLKYMKYSASGDDLLSAQALAFSAVISTHLTVENINRGESFFAEIINLGQTDISAFDYSGSKDKICAFLECSPVVSVMD